MNFPGKNEVLHTLNAFRWSFAGLASAWRTEISFRVDVVLFVIFVGLALWLGDTALEEALMIGVLFIVLVAELLNAAIENVIDMVSPDYHELAGRAKDIASAAVLLAVVNVLVVWGLMLAPRYL